MMRMSKERIRFIATAILEKLKDDHLFEVTGSKDRLIDSLEKAIDNELSLEDRLNAEVRGMLKQYEAEFDSGRADYQKMFLMVKSKLVKERGIVL
ncbi:DUF507 family protein [Candidatus Nitronereus thalassa]|uniref:DUF507 family protein n=1 Tax=Candidatus Nitronereus thalassa TaxID=3020898 RepID=A0ABU3K4T9_9BACT|nr:DUF507 family protein [Candidatus Nitronereus thalassa]MDT7041375.1 DUF507 family protein [Candidatus Nitronereus thalassa]